MAVVELVPVASVAVAPTRGTIAASPPAVDRPGPPSPRPLRLGDVCPVCHAVYEQRPSFTGTFVGCLC